MTESGYNEGQDFSNLLGGETPSAVAAAVDVPAPPAAEAPAPPAPPAPAAQKADSLQRILKIRVPLVVEIVGRKMTLKDVCALRPGTVVEFDKKSDDLLDLFVNNSCLGRGEAVKVGERFGMRVLEIGSVKDRIKMLAK